MRRLIFSFLILSALSSQSEAKTILVVRGIFGNIVAPMNEISDGLRKRGHKVIVAEWFLVPNVRADVAIGHSAGDVVLRTSAKKIITIDPTFLAGPCGYGAACTNFYSPLDRLPFFICCGGYSVNGATNKQVPGTLSFFVFAPGHISMPARVSARVISEASK